MGPGADPEGPRQPERAQSRHAGLPRKAEEKDRIADHIASLAGTPQTAGGPAAPVAALDPGEDIFEENCAMCHTLAGEENPLLPKVAGWDRGRIRMALDRLDTLRGGMPPLSATLREKDALADFLAAARDGGGP